ncbi:metal-dependent hydrolase family protein [Sandaracinobacteroides hominis]|uniref:metal-dependent hydrolase family protein n=1 Tax=Sandaracinobacteroides hominis TaxID=2780086 RepID=UPI001F35A58C|nr:amidohydrolase family protein [Sandaracinobacteroides hominis]
MLKTGITAALLLMSTLVQAAETPAETLFRNVRVYDGRGDALSAPTSVLVRGNQIAAIGAGATAAAGAKVIDGDGRTLMPGLIDAHWHAMFVRPTPQQMLTGDIGFANIQAGAEATATLMRGFTTVRDAGGPVFGLKQAIDADLVAGPRIWPSGAMITVTSGHGDFRQTSEIPRDSSQPLSRMEVLGAAMVADSPDMVRQRVREQLMLGASQIKLTAGGGVSSPHSPLDVSTFTTEELKAAVEAADNWGTYVMVHAYTPAAVRRAIDAGVRVIEHAHLIDDATAKYMAEKRIWLSSQPITEVDFGGMFPPGSDQDLKARMVFTGTDNLFRLVKKYKLHMSFGTDVLFSEAMGRRQGAMLVGMNRWFTPAEVLRQATSSNGELLALSGKRAPYQGKLGVVEVGALADLLLVEGDPISNLSLLADADRNFRVIMKDGRIYKNNLEAE